MKKGIILILMMALVAGLTMIPRQAITNSAAAPPGNTGGPYGTPSCEYFYCHGGISQLMMGWITTNVPDSGYRADSTYQVTVFVNDTGRSIFGFELSTINPQGLMLGILMENLRTTLVGSGQFITHNAGSIASPDSNSWTFDWIAPPQGTGAVTFYASMNAADGDGTASGDKIFHGTHIIEEDFVPLAIKSLDGDANAALSFFPNPANEVLFISTTDIQNSKDIVMVNLQGQRYYINSKKDKWVKLDIRDIPVGLHFLEVDYQTLGRIVIIH